MYCTVQYSGTAGYISPNIAVAVSGDERVVQRPRGLKTLWVAIPPPAVPETRFTRWLMSGGR